MIRGLPNNGEFHLFLGDPMGLERDQTVVERGCAFSPGVWSAGVSLAVAAPEWVGPETRALPLAFEDDVPPVVVSRYEAGPGVRVSCRLCTLAGPRERTCDYFTAHIEGEPGGCRLAVRDIGPAGARLSAIVWEERARRLTVDGKIELCFETPVRAIRILPADEQYESPAAYVDFAGDLRLRVLHGYRRERPAPAFTTADAFAEARRRFVNALPARIRTPDARVDRLWEQTAFHMQSGMACGVPRAGVENYPLLWVRDSVIILRCLDCMGRGDLARIGCEALADTVFGGGFGCESDAPGEGVWALVRHAHITRDAGWLSEVFPAVERRVRWMLRMLDADGPLLRPGDGLTLSARAREDAAVVCYAREGGHIHGRMDWHSPDFYINCWAYAGLRTAAEAADTLGRNAQARAWAERAGALEAEIETVLLPRYGNDRDPCVAPYPTGLFAERDDVLRERFRRWYRQNRLDAAGRRKPEPLWPYFEAAQMHNALLLGCTDELWASLDGFLSDPRFMDMALMPEGEPGGAECLPFGRGSDARGWLSPAATGGNMPHNWATAETFLLLRALLVTEEKEGLTLLAGAPPAWRAPGATVEVTGLPTDLGMLSYRAQARPDGTWQVRVTQGEHIPVRVGARGSYRIHDAEN